MKMHLQMTGDQIIHIKNIIEEMDHVVCTADSTFSTVWIHDEEFHTEFRFAFTGHIKLVISRVCFTHRRSGIMTTLLSKLKDICLEYDVHTITIQSVETPEMVNFCKKNGLRPDTVSSIEIGGIAYGDYILQF